MEVKRLFRFYHHKTSYNLTKSQFKGTFKTVGDREHSEIIRLYVEEGVGMKMIAEKLGRPTRTPMEHIHRHNNAVRRSGFCPACKRAGSSHQGKTAERPKS